MSFPTKTQYGKRTNDSYRFYILTREAESMYCFSVEMEENEMYREIAEVSLETRREQCF